MMETEDHPVVLFDGVCNFCAGSVQFIIRRDPGALFRFAAYQSEAGRDMCARHGIDATVLETFALIVDGKALFRSDAAIATASRLGGLWRLALVFKAVPRVLRDAGYGVIAKNRYRWFGQRESCMVPDANVRRRFLG